MFEKMIETINKKIENLKKQVKNRNVGKYYYKEIFYVD